MAEFIRARSEEQKCQRMAEIKAAALSQFRARPYHEITLTTIADELSWSRANLYKYVRTKEEVFLALAGDLRDAYYAALLEAFPAGSHPGQEEAVRILTKVLVENEDWFRMHAFLFVLLEQNSSKEKLIEFKSGHYNKIDAIVDQVGTALDIPADRFNQFMAAISFHASGIASDCCGTPCVQAALAEIGHAHEPANLARDIPDFLAMCLAWYRSE